MRAALLSLRSGLIYSHEVPKSLLRLKCINRTSNGGPPKYLMEAFPNWTRSMHSPLVQVLFLSKKMWSYSYQGNVIWASV
ncbi:hypothetical protein CC86DRAFT_366810 [Ophiobolus disseminans]|uniref:Uncharacterized protein n=1 Tax=Ophiobolus disseminans TaxID=1469910 RepID=A0A6A7AFE5_9PLEO|nr:hypothetical protein CC86DRAFT_366810 [Ophiobolus disseminans]